MSRTAKTALLKKPSLMTDSRFVASRMMTCLSSAKTEKNKTAYKSTTNFIVRDQNLVQELERTKVYDRLSTYKPINLNAKWIKRILVKAQISIPTFQTSQSRHPSRYLQSSKAFHLKGISERSSQLFFVPEKMLLAPAKKQRA